MLEALVFTSLVMQHKSELFSCSDARKSISDPLTVGTRLVHRPRVRHDYSEVQIQVDKVSSRCASRVLQSSLF